jgi:P27 family predicted phage terminase small subunit
MKSKTQNKPAGLSKESRETWDKLIKEYDFQDAGGLQLLEIYCRAFDRAQECRKQIDIDGMQVKDRFGQLKAHSLLTAEKESRAIMLSALRQMNLDVIPNNANPGRPAGK